MPLDLLASGVTRLTRLARASRISRATASPHDLTLGRFTRELDGIFESAKDKYEAHRRGESVLRAMAADPQALTAVLGRYLSSAANLNTKSFPALSMNIALGPHYELVSNCFFPLGTGETDITTNSIHHHGQLLLTTVTAFGPGYEHWRFTRPESIDPSRDLFAMDVLNREQHERGHLAFVDAYIPHAVMYPSGLTITFALWSDRARTTWREHVKRMPVVRGNTAALRGVASRLGLGQQLGIKKAHYVDYYPAEGAFKGMPERIQFPRGSNEEHLNALFHVVQATHNGELGERLVRDARFEREASLLDNASLVRDLAARVSRDEPIPHQPRRSFHTDVPHMNFKVEAIDTVAASRVAHASA